MWQFDTDIIAKGSPELQVSVPSANKWMAGLKSNLARTEVRRSRPWFSPARMSFSDILTSAFQFLRGSLLPHCHFISTVSFVRKSGKVDSSRHLACTFCPLIAINEINCLSSSLLCFDEAHTSIFSRNISIRYECVVLLREECYCTASLMPVHVVQLRFTN